tara:strand:+ start:136 stop:327 length:192 start_codon:yes stop_codon:yes gene_type:complete
MSKDFEYYKKRTEITKKYAREIKDEIDVSVPNDFEFDSDIDYSIECILDEMYKELRPRKEIAK